jgi:hypothetical protein
MCCNKPRGSVPLWDIRVVWKEEKRMRFRTGQTAAEAAALIALLLEKFADQLESVELMPSGAAGRAPEE